MSNVQHQCLFLNIAGQHVPAENQDFSGPDQHAEVWEENTKIFINDVKSSNGTFVNGERLSREVLENEPYGLKSDNILEFGIDVVGEDNMTIDQHEVADHVVCVSSEQHTLVAACAE